MPGLGPGIRVMDLQIILMLFGAGIVGGMLAGLVGG